MNNLLSKLELKQPGAEYLTQGQVCGHNQEVGLKVSDDRPVAVVGAANGGCYWQLLSWRCVPVDI